MVGKRKEYRPYSKDKLKIAIYNNITARMGAFGTESLLLQIGALSYSENAANSWDEYGNLASKLYRSLQDELKLAGVRAAGLRALVGAAIKFVRAAKYGRLYPRNQVMDYLESVANRVGLDDAVASQAINKLVNEIPTAPAVTP
jgi:hypothetical protein